MDRGRAVASYRLFPIVESAPPASPVALHRNSLDHDLQPTRTPRDREQHAPRHRPRRAPPSAAEDQKAASRPNSQPHSEMADDPAQSRRAHPSPARQPPSAMTYHTNQSQVPGERHRTRWKPNLRIEIAKNDPPKRPSHSPVSPSPSTPRTCLDSPHTPHLAAVAQSLPVVSIGGDMKVRELTVLSTSARAQPPKMPDPAPTRTQPPNALVPCSSTRTSSLPSKLRSGTLSSPNMARPLNPPAHVPSIFSTEAAPVSREGPRHDHGPSNPTETFRPSYAEVGPSPAGSVSGSVADAVRQRAAGQPQAATPHRGHLAAQEGSPISEASHPTPQRPSTAALAAVAAARARVAALQNADPVSGGLNGASAAASHRQRTPNAALAAVAAARANVAALQDLDSPLASPRIVTYGASSGSDNGSLTRSLRIEVLSRRPSISGPSDPVEILKGISEQCEALHARYTSLRMERQKVSSTIIANLKGQKLGPEYCDMLMNEQLSLAAISSSMDICIAKLKSLECRREDVITSLIAQTTQAKASPADNIAAMIASMAISRKASSIAPSDSASCFARTGRSTPDHSVEGLSANRSTCSSFPRTMSYTSDADSHYRRLSLCSRKPSMGSNFTLYTELMDDQMSDNGRIGDSPRPKRRTPLHEPSDSLGELKEEEAGSITNEAAGIGFLPREASLNQVSERGGISRPCSFATSTTDDLLDQPNRFRVDGAKTASILGLLSHDSQRSPAAKLSGAANASPEQQQQTQVETTLHPSTYEQPRLRQAGGPFTSTIIDAPLDCPLDSPSSQDLDAQLGNFPIPSPSVPPKDNIPPPPPPSNPPPPPPKASTTHGEQPQMRQRRQDSPMELQQSSSVQRNKRSL